LRDGDDDAVLIRAAIASRFGRRDGMRGDSAAAQRDCAELRGEERAAAAGQNDLTFERTRQPRRRAGTRDAFPRIGLFANLTLEGRAKHGWGCSLSRAFLLCAYLPFEARAFALAPQDDRCEHPTMSFEARVSRSHLRMTDANTSG